LNSNKTLVNRASALHILLYQSFDWLELFDNV
jgi:hypothetical protein